MISPIEHTREEQVAVAFSRQAAVFDDLYQDNTIIRYKRKRVREHLLRYLKPGAEILEINAGTGEDAIFLARQGYHVHATDISAGMQGKLAEKLAFQQLNGRVSQEICSYTDLSRLQYRGPFDCIFSNFAGLNCTGELEQVLGSFDSLLKPFGIIVLVVLPGFCLWESLLLLKGKFKTATRRFFSQSGSNANIEGNAITCWYYSPRFIVNTLKGKFTQLELEGLCTIVPPSYMEKFPEKYPGLFSRFCTWENRLGHKWPWRNIGDYYIISFRKK